MQPNNKKDGYSANHYLKVRLIEDFYNTVTEGMTDAGCRYFGHNLIINREEPMISSFAGNHSKHPYWEDYWDCNAQDYDGYVITKKVGFQCAGFQCDDQPPKKNQGVTQESLNKIEMCKMKDGFHFYMQHDNGVLENFSFGWEKHTASQVSHQKINDFSNRMDELNIGYFRLNADMFDTYPAIY